MKKLTALILAFICVLSLNGCSSKTKNFKVTDAASITVMSGSTGERIVITDAKDISYITENINAITFSRGEKVNSDGWDCFLSWRDESGNEIERLTVLDGYTVIYDGYFYRGMDADQEIDTAFFDKLFLH